MSEWITSLDLTAIVSTCLMDQLEAKAHGDPRFEKAFVKKLGVSMNSNPDEATGLVRNLLEPTGDGPSFAATIAARIAEGARELTREMEAQERQAKARKGVRKIGSLLGKFFDEQPTEQQAEGSSSSSSSSASSASKGFTLVFGALEDFVVGVEQLVGAPDPVSLSAGMRKDHSAGRDARVEFTTGNYGVTTTSEVEVSSTATANPSIIPCHLVTMRASADPERFDLIHDSTTLWSTRRQSAWQSWGGRIGQRRPTSWAIQSASISAASHARSEISSILSVRST